MLLGVFVIDNEGFRPNVGIIICNSRGQLLWARRVGQNTWQFPQGGVEDGETAEETMYRELFEELGLQKDDVVVLQQSYSWLKYKLPKRMVHWDSSPVCIGQKQKWFLLKIENGHENNISFDKHSQAEFDNWRWVSYWYPIRQVVSFKRDVYRRVLKEFSLLALSNNLSTSYSKNHKDAKTKYRVKNNKNRRFK